jgi:hypothetical protein
MWHLADTSAKFKVSCSKSLAGILGRGKKDAPRRFDKLITERVAAKLENRTVAFRLWGHSRCAGFICKEIRCVL